MEWYYAQDGQQKGPVSDAELAGLVNSGLVTDATLVWHGGLANWQPYREVKDGVASPPVVAPAGAVCCECGGTFPADQVVRYGERSVCAACKPVFLQRLAEGAVLASGQGGCTEEQLVVRDYTSPVGSCLSRGWETYKAHFGAMLGTMAVVGLVFLVVNGVPYLSLILAIVFNGPILGGLWHYFLRHVRREPAVLGDAFSGFSSQFGQLLLANFIAGLLSSLPLIPGYVVLFIGIIAAGAAKAMSAMFVAMAVGGVLIVAGMVATAYLSTLWMFTMPLVADKKLPFWPAMQLSWKMVKKHWWSNFGLMFTTGLITTLPFVLLIGAGIGVAAGMDFNPAGVGAIIVAALLGCGWMLFAMPLALSALATRFQDIFGDLAPRA